MDPCGPCHPLPLKERESKTALLQLIYIEENINCSEVRAVYVFFNWWKSNNKLLVVKLWHQKFR